MVSVEATASDGQQRSGGHGDEDEVGPLLTSAEQCLAVMKTSIKIIHGVSKTFTGRLSDQLLISNAFSCYFN